VARPIRTASEVSGDFSVGEERVKAPLLRQWRGVGNYNHRLKISCLHDDLIDDYKFEGSLTAVLRDYLALPPGNSVDVCRLTSMNS
jgi:hypothetical protein